jgi:phage N-6-adenine-methyltransferase
MAHKRGNNPDMPPKREWCTPQWCFDYLNDVFHFEVDAAATAENTKCSEFYRDCFSVEWKEGAPHFMNPPYDNPKKFVRRAFEQSRKHHFVVACLIPFSNDRWWVELIVKHAHEILVYDGRFPFTDKSGNVITTGTDYKGVCVAIFDGTEEPRATAHIPMYTIPNLKPKTKSPIRNGASKKPTPQAMTSTCPDHPECDEWGNVQKQCLLSQCKMWATEVQ